MQELPESCDSAELFPVHLLAFARYMRDNVKAVPSSGHGLTSNSELRSAPLIPFLGM